MTVTCGSCDPFPTSSLHSSDFQSVNSSLASVTSNITALNATAQNISNQLAVLREELMRLNMTCFADLQPAMQMACMVIPDPGSIPDVNAGLDVSWPHCVGLSHCSLCVCSQH